VLEEAAPAGLVGLVDAVAGDPAGPDPGMARRSQLPQDQALAGLSLDGVDPLGRAVRRDGDQVPDAPQLVVWMESLETAPPLILTAWLTIWISDVAEPLQPPLPFRFPLA